MATPDRDTVYTNDGVNRTVYTRENNSTAWFVGIIVALALLAIAYLVFSANSQPSTSTVDINNTPAVTAPVAPADNTMAPADTNTTPMAPTSTAPTAPADNATSIAPSAPATDLSSAPATTSSAVESTAPATSSAAQ